ncbi:MAG: RNA polymerase I enhancer binding protein [Cirrosporium novae-zelandiae]|nr:MAG: RNA polymerase I enhancer binding protein [Cirrosporium novae-zelandiae]
MKKIWNTKPHSDSEEADKDNDGYSNLKNDDMKLNNKHKVCYNRKKRKRSLSHPTVKEEGLSMNLGEVPQQNEDESESEAEEEDNKRLKETSVSDNSSEDSDTSHRPYEIVYSCFNPDKKIKRYLDDVDETRTPTLPQLVKQENGPKADAQPTTTDEDLSSVSPSAQALPSSPSQSNASEDDSDTQSTSTNNTPSSRPSTTLKVKQKPHLLDRLSSSIASTKSSGNRKPTTPRSAPARRKSSNLPQPNSVNFNRSSEANDNEKNKKASLTTKSAQVSDWSQLSSAFKQGSGSSVASENSTRIKRRKNYNVDENVQNATGVFTNREIESLEQFRNLYCNVNDLSHQDFNNKAQKTGSERNADRDAKEIWKGFHEALPYREQHSLRRFCRRHFDNPTKSRKWSKEEDKQLVQLVAEKGRRWTEIAAELDRNPEAVWNRYKDYLAHGISSKGPCPWTEEEANNLEMYMIECRQQVQEKQAGKQGSIARGGQSSQVRPGMSYWQAVSQKMKTRNPKQCMLKWKRIQEKRENESGSSRGDSKTPQRSISSSPFSVDWRQTRASLNRNSSPRSSLGKFSPAPKSLQDMYSSDEKGESEDEIEDDDSNDDDVVPESRQGSVELS